VAVVAVEVLLVVAAVPVQLKLDPCHYHQEHMLLLLVQVVLAALVYPKEPVALTAPLQFLVEP
jgi:hypothetical protein|tara:strand:+ start:219 stop:407 length:189 start_codon:yes stop_codon:yes gene_type:complete